MPAAHLRGCPTRASPAPRATCAAIHVGPSCDRRLPGACLRNTCSLTLGGSPPAAAVGSSHIERRALSGLFHAADAVLLAGGPLTVFSFRFFSQHPPVVDRPTSSQIWLVPVVYAGGFAVMSTLHWLCQSLKLKRKRADVTELTLRCHSKLLSRRLDVMSRIIRCTCALTQAHLTYRVCILVPRNESAS